eukprot:UN34820
MENSTFISVNNFSLEINNNNNKKEPYNNNIKDSVFNNSKTIVNRKVINNKRKRNRKRRLCDMETESESVLNEKNSDYLHPKIKKRKNDQTVDNIMAFLGNEVPNSIAIKTSLTSEIGTRDMINSFACLTAKITNNQKITKLIHK